MPTGGGRAVGAQLGEEPVCEADLREVLDAPLARDVVVRRAAELLALLLRDGVDVRRRAVIVGVGAVGLGERESLNPLPKNFMCRTCQSEGFLGSAGEGWYLESTSPPAKKQKAAAAEKPAKTTEWMAPMRGEASMQ